MTSDFLDQVFGTVIIWMLSAFGAVGLALLLSARSMSPRRAVRLPVVAVINMTRGVPTSLLVVCAGIIAIRFPAPTWLPDPFPGTRPGLALVAWAVTLALMVGSLGHLAVIFRTGYLALGSARLEQATLLGLEPARRFALLLRESAAATVAPLGARLVHHLHNTAFAALFPVADLFGWVQQRANETFEVSRYVGIGVGTYVVLSLLIWAGFRGLEFWLGRPERAARSASGIASRAMAVPTVATVAEARNEVAA
jgi:ABC-type amino acid transport system permease subunit